MLRLAQVKDGDIILDPMCGNGSLLVEAAYSYKVFDYLYSCSTNVFFYIILIKFLLNNVAL